MSLASDWKPSARLAVIGVPYLWLAVFFLLPFLLVLRISFAQMDGALITPLLTLSDAVLTFRVHLSSYVQLISDDLYLATYLISVKYALIAASICLAIGYPFAYFMARSEPRWQPALLMGVMLPFWTSFLLRVYAWKSLLEPNGWVGEPIHALGLDRALAWLGLIPSPEQLMYSPFSLTLGMTYTYLPFMVLPLFATLSRMDLRLIEAAQDLGATPWQAFWRITVPLSKSGIVAGFMLVFIPCVGEYVIPELLGGAETMMIGRVLWDEFFSNNDWPMASAVAVVMILVIIVPIALFGQNQTHAREAG
jgi:putrescine transport system permease protein